MPESYNTPYGIPDDHEPDDPESGVRPRTHDPEEWEAVWLNQEGEGGRTEVPRPVNDSIIIVLQEARE